MSAKRPIDLVPPVKHRRLRLTKPSDKAAGLVAVKVSLQHLRREMGFYPGMRTIAQMNQKGGFDCSGCAWPDPDGPRSAIAEYCENGAKALAEEATTQRVGPEFFRKHSVLELSKWPDYELGKAGRITQPFILRKGATHYEPATWDEALGFVADELNALDSPDEAIFYTSGRTSNEAAFMYQLFVRDYGTNNLPDCSNMCHECSGNALKRTVGIGKGSVTLHDIHEAEVILIMGQNPGTNHPRMMSALEKCRKNGGKIVGINPLHETGLRTFVDPQDPFEIMKGGTEIGNLHLPVRINGDIPLLKGIMRIMLDAEDAAPGTVFDHDFISTRTEGFDALIQDLRKVRIEDCVEQSGISRKQMEAVAKLCMQNEKIIICWAMGITQHKNGVANIQEIVNLLLLRGAIGKPGAGTCPVRGHSNVQGDRTMGIWEKMPDSFLDRVDARFEIKVPREHGHDTVESIHAMKDGKAKIFFGMGGNFVSAAPDTELTAAAMQNCALTVHISTKLNRSHIVTGEQAVILPCIARSEVDMQKSGQQFISMENSMGIIHNSQGVNPPATEQLLSEPAIVGKLAQKTLAGRTKIDWQSMIDDYDVIRDHIAAVVDGCDDYNRKVREPAGFYLPNSARQGRFDTESGLAQFTVNEMPEHKLEEGQYLLMTIRSHDQYNTTIYGLDDRYRGIENERRVILMNHRDMHAAGLKSKQKVNVVSHFEGETRRANNWYVIPYDIPRRCLGAYFPEANVLVPLRHVSDKANTPASKSVVVTLEPWKG